MSKNNETPLRRSLLGTHPAFHVNEQPASSRSDHCHQDDDFIDEHSHRRCVSGWNYQAHFPLRLGHRHPDNNVIDEEHPHRLNLSGWGHQACYRSRSNHCDPGYNPVDGGRPHGFGLSDWNYQAYPPLHSGHYRPGNNPIDEESSNGPSLSEQDYKAYSPSLPSHCSPGINFIDEERSHWCSLSSEDYQPHSEQVISHPYSAGSDQWQPSLPLQDTSLGQNSDVAFVDSAYTSPTWDENSSMLSEPSVGDLNVFLATEHYSALSSTGVSYSSPISGEVQNEFPMEGPFSPLTPYSESSHAALVDKSQTPVVPEPQEYYDEPLTQLADRQGNSYGLEVHDFYPGSVPSIAGESTFMTSGEGIRAALTYI
ncbi:MAG: hypothetical protein M1813_001245 [Trichoglossum hirsutum]|nr:MAG: hypothetical protein M1813_001245 [Trichoglossum hirsutum]